MATDNHLSDNNMPDSSANLNWADWTGSKASLNRDDEWLKQAFIKHLGQDYWNSRNEYPHPNQAISTLLFYEGNGRLDTDGFEILEIGSTRGIYWLLEYSQDGVFPSHVSSILGGGVASTSQNLDFATTVDGTSGAFISMRDEVGTIKDIRLSTTSEGGTVANANLVWDETFGVGFFLLSNAYLRLSNFTSDPSPVSDGGLWYRSDTDVIRARINGATVDLMTSGSVIVLTNLDLPYVSVSVNTTTTSSQCFVDVDASGANRTITLPSAATLGSGFTYVIRKLDSSNNTVIVDPNSTQTIDGVTTYTLTKQYETLCATSDGTNWVIWSAYNNQLYVAQTATFTVGPRDTVISVSTAAGAVTANLPTAVGIAGREITIKKTTTDANALTVDPSSTQTIDGISTYVMTSQGELGIYSDGANWQIKNASFDGYVARTTAYTSTMADRVIACDMASGAYTVTLLAAASCQGQTLTIIKTTSDANLLTIDANSSETINGVITVGITQQYGSYTLFSTGAAWLIIGATS